MLINPIGKGFQRIPVMKRGMIVIQGVDWKSGGMPDSNGKKVDVAQAIGRYKMVPTKWAAPSHSLFKWK